MPFGLWQSRPVQVGWETVDLSVEPGSGFPSAEVRYSQPSNQMSNLEQDSRNQGCLQHTNTDYPPD